ncbi:MAG: hypothetical protein U0Q12_02035 [Vicinamibacterales bacterium]
MSKRFLLRSGRSRHVLATAVGSLLFVAALPAQTPPAPQPGASPLTAALDGLQFRSIGPATMAGRVDDFAVLESHPSTFYVATATGGLWKTTNNGTTWEVLFQDEDVVSIGDVAIPPDDASLVWVGSGENNNRQSSSWGGGVYKSTDGGHTWTNMGLRDSKHIARVLIDPVDHDIVYVAALGHLWGRNRERGIFKTTDGGLTWTNVLFVDEDTGATELVMDPSNNKVIYAATYQRRRATWGMNGGGPGSAIYKSGDAGRTWTKLTKGIPDGPKGRIGLDVYRKDPRVVYARIEHEKESGVYRSDDAGASWRKMSTVNPRPMYFSQIRIDPNDDHRIYVLGVQLHLSDDGGKTFVENGTLHSDHHAFWIDPADSNHLMTGNDGGVGISYDRGAKWDFVDNIVAAQFYHVGYDMQTPYNVCGGLQDNYSWCGPSAVRDRQGISNWDWRTIGGGDGFVAVLDPEDAFTVYTESQNGNIIRTDRRTNERTVIRPVPGRDERGLRWNWDTPLMISPHNAKTLLAASNRVYRSTDRGASWTAISADLTSNADRDEMSLMGVTGKDIKIAKNDGIAAYPTIVALSESPKKEGLIYAGTEDGLVQVTRDGGKSWTNLTAKLTGVPKGAYVSRLEASRFEEGTVYATFNHHREDDYDPYVLVSADYGATWRSLAANLPKGQAVNCITEDHRNGSVLYVGTEFGLFVSLDKGGSWARVKSGLPTVPIDEITLHSRDNDMILATHGRGVWILDDLTPIQQASEAMKASAFLFGVRDASPMNLSAERTNFAGDRRFWGKNPEPGAGIAYYLKQPAKTLAVTIKGPDGAAVRELAADTFKGKSEAGVHRVYWDLRHQPLVAPPGQPAQGGGGGQFGGGGVNGPFVLPGSYRVTLLVDGKEAGTQTVAVKGDPAIAITDADRKLWHDTALDLHELQRTANDALVALNHVSAQLGAAQELVKQGAQTPPAVKTAMDDLVKRVSDLRRRLGAPEPGDGGEGFGGGGRPPLRNLIGQLKGQVMGATGAPTEMQRRLSSESRGDLSKLVDEINGVIGTALPDLYKALGAGGVQPEAIKALKPVG